MDDADEVPGHADRPGHLLIPLAVRADLRREAVHGRLAVRPRQARLVEELVAAELGVGRRGQQDSGAGSGWKAPSAGAGAPSPCPSRRACFPRAAATPTVGPSSMSCARRSLNPAANANRM